MTSIFRLLFPGFQPAATVENFGVRTHPDAGAAHGDDRDLERKLEAFLDEQPVNA